MLSMVTLESVIKYLFYYKLIIQKQRELKWSSVWMINTNLFTTLWKGVKVTGAQQQSPDHGK